MSKEQADHHDADLVLRLYDLRRELVMRQSRDAINGQFWPRTYDDVLAVTKTDHHLNTPYRQVGSYWEMVYGMVRHGIVNPDYFLESTGEGLYLYAKVAPYIEPLRRDAPSPSAFRNAEYVATQTATGRRVFDIFAARVRKVLESR
jgi:hypothetical protein